MAESGQRKERAELLTHAVKAALLINGGGAVATLGFLQAVWDKAPGLAKWATAGVALFAAGALAAAMVNRWRYDCSFSFETAYQSDAPLDVKEKARSDFQRFHSREKWHLRFSWILFALAVVVLLAGTWIVGPCACTK